MSSSRPTRRAKPTKSLAYDLDKDEENGSDAEAGSDYEVKELEPERVYLACFSYTH